MAHPIPATLEPHPAAGYEMKMPESAPITRRGTIVLLAATILMLLTALTARWPDVYGFITDTKSGALQRIMQAPIHLDDDVMVSLRAGYILNATGIPAFNKGDRAQPSTSYVSPYLFAILLKAFPQNVAVAVYAFLGLFAAGLTAGCLLLFAESKPIGAVLAAALFFTQTNFSYALNGWDHLFQGLFLTYATCISLRNYSSNYTILTASIALVLGSLFRPDGVLIALSILCALYITSQGPRRFLFWGMFPYVLLVAIALAMNFAQFGHLTPTTARLKIGAAPSLVYALKYALFNGLLSYTALTVFAALLAFYVVFGRLLINRKTLPIVAGCVATGIISLYNSDVFPGARMFWAPACVMAAVIAVTAAPLFVLNRKRAEEVLAISPSYAKSFGPINRFPLLRNIAAAIIAVWVIGILAFSLLDRARQSIVTAGRVYGSPTAQQYVVARWIAGNLNPADGPIGFFHLGVSYHLPRFEIADFLGKADEAIATTKVKWGPPGHNKWNIDLTLEKWNPQAIVPPEPSDPTAPGARDNALEALNNKRDMGFAPALVVNERLAKEYAYCYIPDLRPGLWDKWGLFIRRDIGSRFQHLRCS